jgi:hypothetical protein
VAPTGRQGDGIEGVKSESGESGRGAAPWHWEAAAAVIGLAIAYALVSNELRLGPAWLLPVLAVALLIPLTMARRRGRARLARKLSLALAGVATAAVGGSIGLLLARLLGRGLSGTELLRDGVLLWASNIVVFALWYWELDGGGPLQRHQEGYQPTDFLFPQITVGGTFAEGWSPSFVDYLFVAFTNSSAFSPTDTLPLSGRAKLLMMAQALASILTVAVFVARAINILQ